MGLLSEEKYCELPLGRVSEVSHERERRRNIPWTAVQMMKRNTNVHMQHDILTVVVVGILMYPPSARTGGLLTNLNIASIKNSTRVSSSVSIS